MSARTAGGGDVLSAVRDKGARAAARVGGPVTRARDLGVALEAVEERHGARGEAAHRLDDEHPDAVALAESVCVVTVLLLDVAATREGVEGAVVNQLQNRLGTP